MTTIEQAKQVEKRLRKCAVTEISPWEAADTIASLITELEAAHKDAARWNFVSGNGGEDWAVCKWNDKVYDDNWEPIMNYTEIDAAIAAVGGTK